MPPVLRVLLLGRARLLAANDLPMLCVLARRCRAVCAIICVASFGLALAAVLGYRLLPWALVPPVLGGLFVIFVVSASLASRFGRLTNADVDIEYAARIAHLCDINPRCAEYVHAVRRQGRPFTRLDLDELGAIHLRALRLK